MKSDFLIALTQLAAERNLPRDMVLSAIEAALASAYKKDNLVGEQNIAVRLSPTTGDVRVYVLKNVVEQVTDPRLEITLPDAKRLKKEAAIGEVIETESTAYDPGRIAAQTAKQVIMQRLREAERDLVYAEYANRAGEIITATVQRSDPRQVTVDLGRAEGIMPEKEQIPTERYRSNQKVKVFIVEVARTARGPEIIVSRAHRDLLRRLFEMEVPEIFNGVVEIKAIAREPGTRSKVAVFARQEGVDAVGSCVGMRGVRIQNVVQELGGEKIDVVQWHRDPASFIANALNPAQVAHVELRETENTARVVVQDKFLSLAIGKEGQNARLAAKLTGWKIDIMSASDAERERQARLAAQALAEEERKAKAQAEAALIAPVKEIAAPQPAVVAPVIPMPTQPQPEVLRPAAQLQPQPVAAKVVAPAVAAAVRPGEAATAAKTPTPAEQEAILLRQMQEEEQAAAAQAEAERAEEEEEGVRITDDVWKVPQLVPSTGGQIRFAEDILGNRGGGGRRGRRDGEDDARRKGAAAPKRRGKGGGRTEERE